MSINQPTRVFSVFCSGFLSEKIGRKKTLILGSICQILGGLSVFFSRSFTSLFVSVGFCGFFMCLIDTAKYSILSEICLIRFRDQLATIITDVPIDFNADAIRMKPKNEEKIISLFEELEFKTILPRILGRRK